MNLAVGRDGNCPADHFWSRQVRLPGHPAVRRDIDVSRQKDIRKERQERLIGKKFSSKTFAENQEVRVQDPDNKRWSIKGMIVGSHTSKDVSSLSYYIKTEDGNTVWRGARYVRAQPSYISRTRSKRVVFMLREIN